jgi:endo-1,4-beta-xylanase
VDGDYDSDELTAIMKEHIFTVMQGVVVGDTKPYCWDVINEAIGWESHYDNDSLTGRNGLKDGNWYPAMPNYVDQAYIFAREADPDALLFYNDYQLVFKEQRG